MKINTTTAVQIAFDALDLLGVILGRAGKNNAAETVALLKKVLLKIKDALSGKIPAGEVEQLLLDFQHSLEKNDQDALDYLKKRYGR